MFRKLTLSAAIALGLSSGAALAAGGGGHVDISNTDRTRGCEVVPVNHPHQRRFTSARLTRERHTFPRFDPQVSIGHDRNDRAPLVMQGEAF